MTRFYTTAQAGTAPGGHVVRLDGKPARTPMGNVLLAPTAPLAAALADEWAAQGATIVPSTMPLTQLTCTMIDKVMDAESRAGLAAQVARYAATDLICYFAPHPQDLVARQHEVWQPLLDWARMAEGLTLRASQGVRAQAQDPAAMQRVSSLLTALTPIEFTALQSAAAVSGSFVIALALVRGRLEPPAAWEAAFVDDIYQIEKWGEDSEARQNLERGWADLNAAAQFLRLATASS